MVFRFIHTADIHLDSPLKTLAGRNEDLADIIGEASRIVLSRIVDMCIQEQVHALIISGDLYDGGHTSMKTARFLINQLQRLDTAQIKTFLIRGNHDAESKITRELTFPPSVHLFDTRGGTVLLKDEKAHYPIAFHGVSFGKGHILESLLPKFKNAVPDVFNIGLLHTSFNGSPSHDVYAPCTEKELRDKGFQYWALGHIHKRFSYQTGECAIVMPGIPQGRDINEDGVKTVTLGMVDDYGVLTLEERAVSLAEFSRISIHLENETDWHNMLSLVEEKLSQKREECLSDILISRISFTGSTELSWRMRRDAHDVLLNDILVRVERFEKTYLDKIEIHCEPPVTEHMNKADTGIELREIIEQDIVTSDHFKKDIKTLAQALQSQLPADIRNLFGNSEKELEKQIQDWTQDGVEYVLSALQQSSSNWEEP